MNWDGEKYEELEYDLLNEDAETEVAAEVAEAAVNMALALVVDAVLSPLARSGADNLAPSTFLLEEALTIKNVDERDRKKNLHVYGSGSRNESQNTIYVPNILVEIQLALNHLSGLVLNLSCENPLDILNVLGSVAEASSAPVNFPVVTANVVVERDRRLKICLVICFFALSRENAFVDGNFIDRI